MRWAPFAGIRERANAGQTLVIFALASTLLMAGLGLVLDAGYDFAQRRTMQNAADAAALAGARVLSQSTTSTEIYNTVAEVAVKNGVPSSSNVSCWYITDANTDGVAACTANTAPPTNQGTITGVRVDVTEQHGTFAMRVIGIVNSGTAASATAQVQRLATYDGDRAPFLPCGILSWTSDGSQLSILKDMDETYDDNGVTRTRKVVDNSYSYNGVSGYAALNPAAASYDWNPSSGSGLSRPSVGGAEPTNRPKYIIHDQHVQTCGAHGQSFKGLNDTDDPINLPALVNSTILHADTGTKAGPSRRVTGLNGCEAGISDGCIMILPIVDDSGPGGSGNNTYLAGRMWGAFWVTEMTNGSGNHAGNGHYGRLILNYPVQGKGTTGWSSSYTGVIVIRLIK